MSIYILPLKWDFRQISWDPPFEFYWETRFSPVFH